MKTYKDNEARIIALDVDRLESGYAIGERGKFVRDILIGLRRYCDYYDINYSDQNELSSDFVVKGPK